MAKKRKEDSKQWVWIEGLKLDSFGVAHWVALFNYGSDAEAKLILRAISASDEVDLAKSGVSDVLDWRLQDREADAESERKAADKQAAKGRCPVCHAKPKNTIEGKSRGFKAFKCRSCEHVWRISGTRPDNYEPPAPKTAKKKSKKKKSKG